MYGLEAVKKSAAVESEYGRGLAILTCGLSLNERYGMGRQEEGWKEVREQWAGKIKEDLEKDPLLGAYRQFLNGEAGAGENLLRRALFAGGIKSINNVVDGLNLVCAKTRVTLAAFDASKVSGEMRLEVTKTTERLRSIGGKEVEIPAGSLVLRDEERLLSWVGRRDGEASKVEKATKQVWLLGVKVPGIAVAVVEKALLEAIDELSHYFVLGLQERINKEQEEKGDRELV